MIPPIFHAPRKQVRGSSAGGLTTLQEFLYAMGTGREMIAARMPK